MTSQTRNALCAVAVALLLLTLAGYLGYRAWQKRHPPPQELSRAERKHLRREVKRLEQVAAADSSRVGPLLASSTDHYDAGVALLRYETVLARQDSAAALRQLDSTISSWR